jgi:hypothetical protein
MCGKGISRSQRFWRFLFLLIQRSKNMKTLAKGCLFLLIAILLFSCNKNIKDEKIRVIENPSENYRILSGQSNSNTMTHYAISESDDISGLPLILEKANYSHIIKHNNYTVKFATQTADVKIYEDDICIIEKDFVSQDTFIINNNTAIFDRDEKLVFYDLYTKKETEISYYLPYMNFSSSNKDNIFYASSYGGNILRFNDFKGVIDKIEEYNNYIDRSVFVAAFPDDAVDKIDEYKKWGVFVAAFSDGRILSIGTDDQQAPYYTNDLEIRLYDEFGKRITSSQIFLQGHGRNNADYYFDNIDNILFIYNHTKNDITNVYRFNNNSIYEQKMPGFGHIIKRIEYNDKIFYVSYIRNLGKIYFYNTELELEATMDVYLSGNNEIADVEIINNTIKVYEYLPGK